MSAASRMTAKMGIGKPLTDDAATEEALKTPLGNKILKSYAAAELTERRVKLAKEDLQSGDCFMSETEVSRLQAQHENALKRTKNLLDEYRKQDSVSGSADGFAEAYQNGSATGVSRANRALIMNAKVAAARDFQHQYQKQGEHYQNLQQDMQKQAEYYTLTAHVELTDLKGEERHLKKQRAEHSPILNKQKRDEYANNVWKDSPEGQKHRAAEREAYKQMVATSGYRKDLRKSIENMEAEGKDTTKPRALLEQLDAHHAAKKAKQASR